MAQPRTLGYAVVGLGRAGQFHLTSLRALTDAELRWVVDTNEPLAQEVAARERCQWSATLQPVLDDPRVDAVIIASSTQTHYPYIKAALGAKKACFSEKPISHDPDELREVVEAAVASPRPFVVGFQRRVDPNFRELRKQLQAGAVGGLRLIKCCSRDNPVPPLEYLRTSGGIWPEALPQTSAASGKARCHSWRQRWCCGLGHARMRTGSSSFSASIALIVAVEPSGGNTGE